MRAAVLSIGSELLRGDIVDTNATFLARELSQLGFEVQRLVAVGDDMDTLTGVLRGALSLVDVIVCTGGLGPTQDDLTRQAIATAVGEEPYVDETLVEQIEARFQSMRRRMPERNKQQALLIPSARAIPNPNGTAPGWLVRKDNRVIVAMPGPPSEMQPMWRDAVFGELEALLPGEVAMLSLMTFGLGESAVEERIDDVIAWRPEVTVATYAKSNGVQVHVTARAQTGQEAQRLAEMAEGMLRERLGEAIFGMGDTTLQAAIGEMLGQRGMTLAVMESATGGALASMITDQTGSSAYFVGGITAYSKETKARYGVDSSVMDEYGLISKETARAMAEAARGELRTDVGIAVTGIAGSESIEGKPPGTCYIAVSLDDRTEVREIRRPGRREVLKHYFAQCALDLLRRQLLAQGAPV